MFEPLTPTRVTLAHWREVIFTQKYRFDLGLSFLTILNFMLLIITASDKLMVFFGIERLRSLLVAIIPLGFLGVWLFGTFMDRVVRAPQMAERQNMRRSEVWSQHTEQMDRLEAELAGVKAMLEKRKRVQKGSKKK